MIEIDNRFNGQTMDMISKMPGAVFHKYRSDPFVFTASVYGIVGLYIGNGIYRISNFVQPADFFGKKEDVAVFLIDEAAESEIKSCMDDGVLIDTPIDSIIKKITVVNEHQQLFNQGIQTYDVYVTRAIIFEMEDGGEISFEKDIWFSEEINIRRGHDLIDKLSSTDSFAENWEGIEGYDTKCDRESIIMA